MLQLRQGLAIRTAAVLWLAVSAFCVQPATARNLALLVGVADYDEPSIRSLLGPRNDVVALWRWLTRSGFAAGDVTVLTDGLPVAADVPPAKSVPTRAAIIAALEDLAQSADAGDFVLFHFSGHGTTQPDNDPASEVEPEPGGRDQVLLPKDAGRWDKAAGTIANAIVDDELAVLLGRIRDKGATVWAVIDACHSGSVTRSAGVTRTVSPDSLGVPEVVAPSQRTPAAEPPRRNGSFKGAQPKGSLIGFFAVDSWTEAIEAPVQGAGLIPGNDRFGVFTWHLLRALNSGRAQTYRDLARLVSLDIAARARTAQAPLPVFDGDLDLGLLGAVGHGPARFAAQVQGDSIVLSAGQLQGLDAAATVGLYDGPGAAAKRVGGARVFEADAAAARAEPLDGFVPPDDQPLWAALEAPGVTFRYRVAAAGAEAAARLRTTLADAGGDERQLAIEFVADGDAYDLMIESRDRRLWLVPDGRVLVADPASHERSVSIPIDGEAATDAALRRALFAFARAANLVRLASAAGDLGGSAEIEVMLTATRETDPKRLADPRRACGRQGQPGATIVAEAGAPTVLGHCDMVQLTVTNRGPRDIDVGVFFVDPASNVALLAGDMKQSGCIRTLPAHAQHPLTFTAPVLTWSKAGPERTGLMRMLVFAIPRTDGVPPSLCHLVQPSPEAARAEATRLRAAGKRTALVDLLERAALLEPGLRAANPAADTEAADAAPLVRQFTIDLRVAPDAR